jgi:hypothetical protein
MRARHRRGASVVVPTAGHELAHDLLTGHAKCGVCGGSLHAASRGLKGKRRHVYVCSYYHERGRSVCTNGLTVPVEVADEAVLTAIEHNLLRPHIVAAALESAVSILSREDGGVTSRRDAVAQELAAAENELRRYAEAIATAAPLPSILDAIKTSEERRMALRAECEAWDARTPTPLPNRQTIDADLRRRVREWRGVLRRQTTEARTILGKLLADRLVFTPSRINEGRYYEFPGNGTLSPLLAGAVVTGNMVTPAGFEPAISTLKGSSSIVH